MKELRLFEYAVILQPLYDKDGAQKEKGEVVVTPIAILAADQEQATLLANRAIPDEFMDRLERLTVALRPF